MPAQIAAGFAPRRIIFQSGQQRLQRFLLFSHPIEAAGQLPGGVNLIFHPSVRTVQEIPQNPDSFLIFPMGQQFPAIVIHTPAVHGFSRCPHLPVNPQIPSTILCLFLPMLHRNIRKYHIAGTGNRLMHPPLKPELQTVLYDPFPKVGKGGTPIRIEGRDIGHHHHVHLRLQIFLQPEQLSHIRRSKHVIRVQPHTVFFRGPGKGVISGCGKIIPPYEIKYPVRILPGDLLRPVQGSRIHNDNLIHCFPDTVQTSGQHLFLVPHDHAHAYGNHPIPPSFPSLYEREKWKIT